MKAKVDRDTCIGCGICESLAAEVFRMNSDGKAEAYAEGLDELIVEAMESCPVGAISEE